MARPIKNNADYFPHDADMRNDPKVKAVRRKFGIEGYGVYVMLIELLTDSDYFQFKNDAMTIEIVAGDFDINPDKLTEILFYLNQIDLIQIDAETNTIQCKSLDNRLEPLLSKRKRDRSEVIASDNTQSKVKESKGDQRKVNKSMTLAEFQGLLNDEIWKEQMQMIHKFKNLDQAIAEVYGKLIGEPARFSSSNTNDFKSLVNSWLANMRAENTSKSNGQPAKIDLLKGIK